MKTKQNWVLDNPFRKKTILRLKLIVEAGKIYIFSCGKAVNKSGCFNSETWNFQSEYTDNLKQIFQFSTNLSFIILNNYLGQSIQEWTK